MTPESPVFIPLCSEPYTDFSLGLKDTEFRHYGKRWNEKTCKIGRAVVLSLGYGKKSRIIGIIADFTRSFAPTETNAWKKCYGERVCEVACIRIDHIKKLDTMITTTR